MNMFLQFDRFLFRWVNRFSRNEFFDIAMPLITNKDLWLPFLIVALIYLFIRGGTKGKLYVGAALIGFGLTDQLSSGLLKPLIKRVRPCNVLDNVHLLIHCSSSFAFPSGHATNSFGLATVFGMGYRKLLVPFTILAMLVSYSRVYVGVHYPLDIFGGAIIGMGVGLGMHSIAKKLYSSKLG